MMRRFWLLAVLFIPLAFHPPLVVLYAEDEPFVYQRSSRDPFMPWVTPEGKLIRWEGVFGNLEDVVLEGILWDPKGGSVAMMNGRIVHRGDRIGRFEVGTITKDEVTLKAGEEVYTLRFEKPELGEETP